MPRESPRFEALTGATGAAEACTLFCGEAGEFHPFLTLSA
jgi:hypothetical protein